MYAGWSPACARSFRAASSCGTARFDALMYKEFWGFGPLVVLSHSVVLLDRLSSLMTGFILELNHSWLCAVRSAQSSGSKLLRSPAALAKVREAIDTGEGRGGVCGPVCIRNVSLARNSRAAASLVFSFMVFTGTISKAVCVSV